MTETPPGTDIVPTGHLNDRMKYAQALAAADLLPAAYRKKPANVLLAMEYGHALGLDTVTAMQSVHVIDGKPTASAQLIGALVRRAGHRLRVTGDDQKAVAIIVRHDDPDFEFRSEWNIDRAMAAGLTGRGPWKQYPAAMMKARAITEVARDACPEVLAGVAYTPEELGDDHGDWHPTAPVAPEPVATIIPAPEPVVEATVVTDESEPFVKASQAQLKAVATILRVIGATEHDDRHAIVARILGVDDYDAGNISKEQASTIIAALKLVADADDRDAALAALMK